MLNFNHLKFLTLGMILLLAACGEADTTQFSPVEALPATEQPAAVHQNQPTNLDVEQANQAEPAVIGTEIEAAPVVVEEAKPLEEAPVMAEATGMAGQEEVMIVEAAPVEGAEETGLTEPETASVHEETMAAETEEKVMPAEEVAVEQAGPTPEQQQLLASLQNRGAPPELFNEVWLNSEPLKLADLRGKVVIVEFWTFGCINCKNVLPSLREWHHKYKDEGLVIIGVHTPEFDYESDIENVKAALVDQDVPYPVAIDNDWQTWRAYHNRYWPCKYFIDKAGNLRHIHIGEGRYMEQEEIIKALLAEKV